MTETEMRELDARIAENVFSYPHTVINSNGVYGIPPNGNQMLDAYEKVPSYTTDSAASMDLLKIMVREKGRIQIDNLFYDGDNWRVFVLENEENASHAETLELAICQFAKNLFSK